MLTAVGDKSPALRRLDIRHPSVGSLVGPMLAATHARLRELAAPSSHGCHIAKHCVGLGHLNLRGNLDDLPDILRILGPTLEVLDLRWETRSTLELIRAHCPLLSLIVFKTRLRDPASLSAYADLLSSYGTQLLYGIVDNLPPALVVKVVTASSNMIFKLVTDQPDMANVLLAMGKSLSQSTHRACAGQEFMGGCWGVPRARVLSL